MKIKYKNKQKNQSISELFKKNDKKLFSELQFDDRKKDKNINKKK